MRCVNELNHQEQDAILAHSSTFASLPDIGFEHLDYWLFSNLRFVCQRPRRGDRLLSDDCCQPGNGRTFRAEYS